MADNYFSKFDTADDTPVAQPAAPANYFDKFDNDPVAPTPANETVVPKTSPEPDNPLEQHMVDGVSFFRAREAAKVRTDAERAAPRMETPQEASFWGAAEHALGPQNLMAFADTLDHMSESTGDAKMAEWADGIRRSVSEDKSSYKAVYESYRNVRGLSDAWGYTKERAGQMVGVMAPSIVGSLALGAAGGAVGSRVGGGTGAGVGAVAGGMAGSVAGSVHLHISEMRQALKREGLDGGNLLAATNMGAAILASMDMVFPALQARKLAGSANRALATAVAEKLADNLAKGGKMTTAAEFVKHFGKDLARDVLKWEVTTELAQQAVSDFGSKMAAGKEIKEGDVDKFVEQAPEIIFSTIIGAGFVGAPFSAIKARGDIQQAKALNTFPGDRPSQSSPSQPSATPSNTAAKGDKLDEEAPPPAPIDGAPAEAVAQGATPEDADPNEEAPAQVQGKKGVNIIKFIQSNGGLQPSGELDAIGAGRYPGLINQGGLSADEMRERMVEAGYLQETGPDAPAVTTPGDVYDMLGRAIGGERIVPLEDQADERLFNETSGARDAFKELKHAEDLFVTPALEQYQEETGDPTLTQAYRKLRPEERMEAIDRVRRGEDIGDVVEEMLMQQVALGDDSGVEMLQGMVIARGPDPRVVDNIRTMLAKQQPQLLAGFDDMVAGLPQRTSKARKTVKQTADRAVGTHTPAVPVKHSVTPQRVISLIDGSKYPDLRRHLMEEGITAEAYQQRYGLDDDYPLIAPNEIARIAEQLGRTYDEVEAESTIGAAKAMRTKIEPPAAEADAVEAAPPVKLPEPRPNTRAQITAGQARAAVYGGLVNQFMGRAYNEDLASTRNRFAESPVASAALAEMTTAADGLRQAMANNQADISSHVRDVRAAVEKVTKVTDDRSKLATQWLNRVVNALDQREAATDVKPAKQKPFATQIQEIANGLSTPPFQDRVSIAQVYDAYAEGNPDALSMDAFKKKLVQEASVNRTLELGRLDLPERMDKRLRERSTAMWGRDEVHTIVKKETGGQQDQQQLGSRFLTMLASKTPRAKWGSSLGVSDAELRPHIEAAIKAGILVRDRNGVPRRAGKQLQQQLSPEGIAADLQAAFDAPVAGDPAAWMTRGRDLAVKLTTLPKETGVKIAEKFLGRKLTSKEKANKSAVGGAALTKFADASDIARAALANNGELAGLIFPGQVDGADVMMTPKAASAADRIKAAVDSALRAIRPATVRADVIDNIEIGRLAHEDMILSAVYRSSPSAMLDESTEVANEQDVDAGTEIGREGDAVGAGQSAARRVARDGEGRPAAGNRVAGGLESDAEQRILRQASASLRSDGSIFAGRPTQGATSRASRDNAVAQDIGETLDFDLAGYQGRVEAEPLEEYDRANGNLARLTYRGYVEGIEVDEFTPASVEMSLVQHADGAWEIENVEVHRKREGLGSQLYAAVEKDLGIRMSPSGLLSDDGLAFWKKRSPASVRWHQKAPALAGFNFSPRYVKKELDRINVEMTNISQGLGASGNIPLDARENLLQGYRHERKLLLPLWGKLPAEARGAVPTMFSLRAEPAPAEGYRTNAKDQELKLPFAEKWGDPRGNEDDHAAVMQKIWDMYVNINPATAHWSTLATARKELDEIAANLYYYDPAMSATDIVAKVSSGEWSEMAFFAYDKYRQLDPDRPRLSIFNLENPPEDIVKIIASGKRLLDHWWESAGQRPGLEHFIASGDHPRPRSKGKADPKTIGQTRGGFFFNLARKLKDAPDALFKQGVQAVINHLEQAGVKRAEIKHFGLTEIADQTLPREAVEQTVANRMFAFRRKTSWLNPEVSPNDYGTDDKTRAFRGPRIPGRGIYFERLMAFPKRLKGGAEFAPGNFEAPHWEEQLPGTWASWRGSLRDVPDWGRMAVGEEGQTDFMQGTTARNRDGQIRRPRVSQEAFLDVKGRREEFRQVRRDVERLIRSIAGEIGLTSQRGWDLVRLTQKGETNRAIVETKEAIDAFNQRLDEPALAEKLAGWLGDLNRLVNENEEFFGPDAEKFEKPGSTMTPVTPIDETYVRTMVRDLLILAASKKADSIAISTTETTARVQNNPGAAHFYDTQLRSALEKELRRITGDGKIKLEKVALPKPQGGKAQKPFTVWAAKLSPQVRDKIVLDGLPLMSLRGFTSPALRAAEMLKQDRGSGEQFLNAILSTPGVKRDELDWMGLPEYLAGKKSIAKYELMAWMKANRVVLDEKLLGQGERDPTEMRTQFKPVTLKEANELGMDLDEELDADSFKEMYSYKVGAQQFIIAYDPSGLGEFTVFHPASGPDSTPRVAGTLDGAKHQAYGWAQQFAGDTGGTMYGRWKIPGGERYREMLIRVPRLVGRKPTAQEVARAKELESLAEAAWDAGDHASNLAYETEWNALRAEYEFYESIHFDDQEIAHIRFDDRVTKDGRRVLFINELQSDLHQQARNRGYTGAESPADRAARYKAASDEFDRVEDLLKNRDIDDIEGVKGGPYSMTNKQVQAYSDRLVELTHLMQALTKGPLPNAPFKGDLYMELALKRMLQYAVEGGYDAISWANAEQIAAAVQETKGKLQTQYEQKIPSFLTKYVKKWGGKIEEANVDVGDDTNKLIMITPEMRASIASGQSLYTLRDGQPNVSALGATDPVGQILSFSVQAIEAEAARSGKPVEEVARQAARHEMLELFRALNLVTPMDWRNLQLAAQLGDWVGKTGVRAAYTKQFGDLLSPAGLEELIVKESIMEMYGQYRRGDYKPKGFIDTVFKRISNFLESISNWLAGAGFTTWDQIFQRFDAGELRQRHEQIFGRESPETFWKVAKSLDKGLVGDPARAIDEWVGGAHDTAERGMVPGGLMMPGRLEGMSDSDLESMARPMRDALRASFGDTIPVYRGQQEAGGQSEGRKNRLASYSTNRRVAESFAGVRGEAKVISEAEIAAAEKQFAATGEATVGGKTFRDERAEGLGIMMYRGGEAITDVESIRGEMDRLNEFAAENNAERAKAMSRVTESRIPVDSVVWATDRFNQQEIIARQEPLTSDGVQPIIRAGQLPDARTFMNQAGAPGELEGITEILNNLRQALGMTVRTGRLDQAARRAARRMGGDLAGQYTGVVRTVIARDADTTAHEAGHHMERLFGSPLRQLMFNHQLELLPMATPGAPLSEGFAEFFRRYLTNPAQARTRAPNFYRDFEDFVDAENPEMLENLQLAQQAYERLVTGDPVEQGIANQTVLRRATGAFMRFLDDAETDGYLSTIGDRLHGFYQATVASHHGWTLAVRELLNEVERTSGMRVTLRVIDNPAKMIRLAGHTAGWASMDLKRGIALRARPNGGGTSMHQVLATAFGGTEPDQWNERAVQEFGEYLIARRAVHEYVRWRPAFRQTVQAFVQQNPPLAFLLQRLPTNTTSELENRPTKEPLMHQLFKLKLLEERQPQFRQAAELYYDFNRDIIRFLFEKQLITRDERDRFLVDRDYAPFQRDMSDRETTTGEERISRRPGRARDVMNKRDVFDRFRGSDRDIINPIQSTVQLVYEMRLRAAINDTFRSLDRLARAAGRGGNEIFERLPATEARGHQVRIREALRAAARNAGMSQQDTTIMLTNVENQIGQNAVATLFTHQQASEKGEKIVWFFENGEPVPAQLPDGDLGKMMFSSLTAMGDRGADILSKVLAIPANAVRAGVTMSPAFIIRNIWVDGLMAPTISPHVRFPFGGVARGLPEVISGGRGQQLYNRYGGLMGGEAYTSISDQSIERDVQNLRNQGWRVNMPGSLSGLIQQMFAHGRRLAGATGPSQLISPTELFKLSELSETAGRVGIYNAARESAIADGMSQFDASIEAAHYAHDVMDFSRHGSKTEFLRRSIPFFNAAIQGSDKYWRTMAGANDYGTLMTMWVRYRAGLPISQEEQRALGAAAKAWFYTAAVFGGMSILFSALNDDDEDVAEVPDNIRATHWVVSINGILSLLPKSWKTFIDESDGSIDEKFRLPKGFESAWFANGVERAWDYFKKNDPTAFQRYLTDLWAIMTPPDGLPGLDLLYGFWSGKDMATGRDIVPAWEKDLERKDQFGPYTTETAKKIGEKINMSPYQVDFLVRGLGATLARDITSAIDRGMGKGPAPSISDYPVAQRFTHNTARSSRSLGQFYDMLHGRDGMNAWFWDTVSSDARSFGAAGASYKKWVDAGQKARADQFYDRLNPDQKAFATLAVDFTKRRAKLRNLHPIINAQEAVSIGNALVKEVIDGKVSIGKDKEPKQLSRDQMRLARDELRHIQKGMAQNALHILNVEGWGNMPMMDVDKRMKVLKAVAPEVYSEFTRRLEAKDVQSFKHLQTVWPKVKDRLLAQRADADVGEFAGGKVEVE